MAVVMGCDNPVDKAGNIKRLQFSESSRLLQWGFDNFEEKNILDSTFPAGEVKVTLSKEADYVTAVPEKTITAELPKDVKIEDFDISTDLYEEVEAPVKKGDELGKMTVSLGDTDYGTVKLVAANDVSQSAWLARKAGAVQSVLQGLGAYPAHRPGGLRHRRDHPRPHGRTPPQSVWRNQTPQRPWRRIPWRTGSRTAAAETLRNLRNIDENKTACTTSAGSFL